MTTSSPSLDYPFGRPPPLRDHILQEMMMQKNVRGEAILCICSGSQILAKLQVQQDSIIVVG